MRPSSCGRNSWRNILLVASSTQTRWLGSTRQKNFKVTKNFTLASEFFKHLGHFTDEDLKVFVQHLLGKTPDRKYPYPKVTVYKTSKLHQSHYSAAE
jgi:hypothetical protein